ncbi:MAG TPA: PQQ-dependent sugar dehydrogenase, partial [Trueperaceae bacterium]
MALAACSAPTRPDSGSKSGPKSQPTTLKLEQVTSGLTIPWELAFTPDGSLYFTERPGRVDKLTPAGKLVPIPFQQPHDVYQDAESGLMGMALAPSFPDSPLIYLCYSYLDEEGHPRTQIARFTLEEGALADQKTLLVFPDAGSHNGCRLAFGPDGRLYGTIGDFAHPQDAQDLGVLAGKTVRINPDGSIPPDNPFIGQAGARPEIWT